MSRKKLRAVASSSHFSPSPLSGWPFQWLLLKLKSPAARTFSDRYHRWSRQIFGIHIHASEAGERRSVLLVANHTSWADIVIFPQ